MGLLSCRPLFCFCRFQTLVAFFSRKLQARCKGTSLYFAQSKISKESFPWTSGKISPTVSYALQVSKLLCLNFLPLLGFRNLRWPRCYLNKQLPKFDQKSSSFSKKFAQALFTLCSFLEPPNLLEKFCSVFLFCNFFGCHRDLKCCSLPNSKLDGPWILSKLHIPSLQRK